MKRELKPDAAGKIYLKLVELQSLSRWKGNWNGGCFATVDPDPVSNCRAYPDEKGIETNLGSHRVVTINLIAEPIPMKRELKLVWVLDNFLQNLEIAEPIPMKRELKRRPSDAPSRAPGRHCRAYPDEKGIETPMSPGRGSHVTDGKPDILIRPC